MADPNPPSTSSSSSPRWLRYVLIGSVALNLLIMGLVAGAMLSPEGPRAQRAVAVERLNAVPLVRALEPSERRVLLQSLRKEQTVSVRAATAPQRVTGEAILVIIRAEPFDGAALSELLEAQRQAGQLRQIAGERALVQTLSEMSAAEREAYAERLQEAMERRPSKKNRD